MQHRLFRFALVVLAGFEHAASGESIAPLSIPPSQYWDGDDGSWSTFFVQVGTPAQSVRLLPGTSASAGSTTWVVIPEGCVDVNPSLSDCANDRGFLFQSNESSSWSTKGLQVGVDGAIFSLNTFEESNLGLVGNASYGYDIIALGLTGSGLPTLEHQVVAGIWTDDFFLGSLGLSPVPSNFTTLSEPQASLLWTLRNQSHIPSTSWAYTAGAYYHQPPVFGSLTLGGFDTTRFTPNELTFSFGADFSRDLLVSLQSVTYSTGEGNDPLLSGSIDIFIDSMVTEVWLPIGVCEAFAEKFNLTWNSQGQLYLIEDSAHAALLAQDPSFTFAIGQAGGGGQAVDIVLPYAAFDLELKAPIVGDTTRYFPLKQAQNSSQYTLGRTFLQEAYVIADYERHNFSVSQALFPPTSLAQNIVTIHPPGSGKKKGNGMSAGAIAGVAVGCAVVAAAAILAAILAIKRRRKRRRATPTAAEAAHSTSGSSLVEKFEIDGREAAVYEADVRSPTKPELHGDEKRRLYEAPGEEVNLCEMAGKDPAAVELP